MSRSSTPSKIKSNPSFSLNKTPTPPKIRKCDDELSPRQPCYTFDSLNEAINQYFSPKRKSPKRSPSLKSPNKSPKKSPTVKSPNKSPGRPRKNQQPEIDFYAEENTEDDENIVPFSSLTPSIQPVSYDLTSLNQYLKKYDESLSKEYKGNFKLIQSQFNKFLMILQTREFSLLFHGLGSKRKLLKNFSEYIRDDEQNELIKAICFEVDGYNPLCTVKKILETIDSELNLLIGSETKKASLQKFAKQTKYEIESKKKEVFLIVHNIDGRTLRGADQQEALSILAHSKNIRFVASADHINASLLWNTEVCDRFSWLYITAPTGHCYNKELMVGGGSKVLGMCKKSSGNRHTLETLEIFWKATTSNMHIILQQLALHAPMVKENARQPLSLSAFCQILREEFATTSETALRQQMVEFEDHQLVRREKGGNIVLAIDRTLLVTFLDKKPQQQDS